MEQEPLEDMTWLVVTVEVVRNLNENYTRRRSLVQSCLPHSEIVNEYQVSRQGALHARKEESVLP